MEIINFFAKEYTFYLMSAVVIFLGISLFLIKNNLLLAILALEIAFNGINLLFATASHYSGDVKGKMVVLIGLAISAGSFAIGLILVVNYYRVKKTLSMRELSLLGEDKDD
ncbi:MAG: NADH-quinone oxidoreductase subunit NuoK [Caldimicrobium sp.]